MSSIERVLGRSRYAERAGVFNNAEMVVWQSTRRFWLAGAVAAGGIALRLTRMGARTRLADPRRRAGVRHLRRASDGRH